MKKIALLMSLLIIIVSLSSCTKAEDLHDTVIIRSEHYTIDAAVLSFWFYSVIDSIQIEAYGATLSQSLKDQNFYSDITWFDYIMNYQVLYNISDYLYFAEWGHKNGVELNDRSEIDSYIAEIEAAAKKYGLDIDDYLSKYYGRGVNKNDVIKVAELMTYGYLSYEAFIAAHQYNEAELEEFKNAHIDDYSYVSYVSYTFNADGGNDTAKEAAKCNNLDELKSFIKSYLITNGTSEEESSAAIEKIIETSVTKNSESQIIDFAFENEREVGDTAVLENSVYMITKTSHLRDYAYRDVRHILFKFENYDTDEEALAKAEEILDIYQNGEKTEEAFSALSKKYNEDGGSKENGGLYEGVDKGKMVPEFENWLFDTDRVVGDVDIVKTTYGYHIMYFVKEGQIVWQKAVSEAMLQSDMEKLTEEFTVDLNEEKLDAVPGDVRVGV